MGVYVCVYLCVCVCVCVYVCMGVSERVCVCVYATGIGIWWCVLRWTDVRVFC